MRLATFDFTPFEIKFSFHRLINAMHLFIDDPEKNEMKKTYFKDLLDRVSQVPSLLEPIIEPKILHDNAVLI